ncbi:MAG: fibronectin type III domain-containing protein [Deltaproteobacteria bacterium]|nr:fibronectin type III domain-containing protein [Deltaproteobacteria bacterium]
MPIRLKGITPRDKHFRPLVLSLMLFGLAAVLFGGLEVKAEQVTLAWDPNTESDLAGYRIHLGTASNAYQAVIDVGNQTSFTVTNLNRGASYFFSVTAYNTQGLESDYSNEVDKTVVTQYQLSVGKRGSGLGSVTGEGINCGADCQGIYDEGSRVTLNVTPAAGSVFTGWSGDDCSGLGECILTMWSDKSLSAGLLSQTNNVAKKSRQIQIAADSAGPTVRRAKENRDTLANESATPYYVITRKTDRRGTTSRYESLAIREGVLRSQYTSN